LLSLGTPTLHVFGRSCLQHGLLLAVYAEVVKGHTLWHKIKHCQEYENCNIAARRRSSTVQLTCCKCSTLADHVVQMCLFIYLSANNIAPGNTKIPNHREIKPTELVYKVNVSKRVRRCETNDLFALRDDCSVGIQSVRTNWQNQSTSIGRWSGPDFGSYVTAERPAPHCYKSHCAVHWLWRILLSQF